MKEDQVETMSFEYLYDKDMEELIAIGREKQIPNLDELDREELISAIELAVLSGLEEAENADLE